MRFIWAAALLAPAAAQAWPWNSEPQPIVYNGAAVKADAGSPLAWDNSLRGLFFIRHGAISLAKWDGAQLRPSVLRARADAGSPAAPVSAELEAGLLVDPGWHLVFYVAEGQPRCLRWRTDRWIPETLGPEPVTKLLAVDERQHALFAYDAAARAVRRYRYSRNAWGSEIIAAGLGAASEPGAFDPVRGALYTTHATADAAIARQSGMAPLETVSANALLDPWPLLETRWNGAAWTTRVLFETGIPQQPAVRPADGRVFFTTRTRVEGVCFFQPAVGKVAERAGSAEQWRGQPTFVDDDSYVIKKPNNPPEWSWPGGSYSSSVSMIQVRPVPLAYPVSLTPPIEVVPYYKPVWEEVTLPERVARFRALVNPRQGRLVQHRELWGGEVRRRQTGAAVDGYLYRDAAGQMVRSLVRFDVYRYDPFTGLPLAAQIHFPRLDATFDPANPPTFFSKLTDPAGMFGALTQELASASIPAGRVLDSTKPYVPEYLARPVDVRLFTSGHSYATPLLNQRGARHRTYWEKATELARPAGLAVDRATGATFYTQAPWEPGPFPELNPKSAELGFLEPAPALDLDGGFIREPQPKYARPQDEGVWIVMVY